MTLEAARPLPAEPARQATQTRRSGRGRLVAVRAGFLLLGVFLPLLLLELALRLAGPLLPGDYQTAAFTGTSAVVGRQNKPNSAGWRRTQEFTTWVQINSRGLRGPEADYAHPPSTYRILALGDSFTFALQVDEEQTFVRQLATLLNAERPGAGVETLNAGVDGWSTANEYAWLVTEGYRYDPDLVLLMYYVGNDPGDNADLLGSAEQVDRLQLGADQDIPLRGPREALSNVSMAYNLFEQGVLAKLTPAPDDPEPTDKAPKAQRNLDAERKERGWAISEALLARMRDFTAARGARLFVVGIPTAGQVADNQRAGKPLMEICERLGIPAFDLLETFRAQPRAARERLYFSQNRHFTPAGHSLVASLLATQLRERGLVPAAS
jgi:lysophospholipase L1-like esterase